MNNDWSDEGIELLRGWAAKGHPSSERPALAAWMRRRPKDGGFSPELSKEWKLHKSHIDRVANEQEAARDAARAKALRSPRYRFAVGLINLGVSLVPYGAPVTLKKVRLISK